MVKKEEKKDNLWVGLSLIFLCSIRCLKALAEHRVSYTVVYQQLLEPK